MGGYTALIGALIDLTLTMPQTLHDDDCDYDDCKDYNDNNSAPA